MQQPTSDHYDNNEHQIFIKVLRCRARITNIFFEGIAACKSLYPTIYYTVVTKMGLLVPINSMIICVFSLRQKLTINQSGDLKMSIFEIRVTTGETSK